MAVDLAGKVIDSDGDPKASLTVDLWEAATWETYKDGGGGARTATDATDADGLWAFTGQDITKTWLVAVLDGTGKYFLIDSRNSIQLTKADFITDINTNTINEHTSGSGVTIDGLIIKDSMVLDTALKAGRDSDNLIDFATTDNKIIFRVEGVNEVELVQNALSPVTSDGVALGTTALEWSDLYLADGAVLGFGDDQDVTLTHVEDTGLLLSSTDKLQFGDAGTFIHQSADGVLTIESDTTVDINGAVVLNGAITGATDITLSGELDAASLDIEGNADINGILEADAYTVDGTTLAEYIADTAGAMFSSNTETGLSATYQDGDNTVDLEIAAAQTTITSIHAANLILGEDSQTAIDFGTTDEIDFKAANAARLTLTSGALYPVTDDEIDLGTSGLKFKDAWFDGTVTADAVNIDGGAIDGTVIGANSAAAIAGTTGTFSGVVDITDATNSSDASGDTGALRTEGGASIAQKLYVGTDLDVDGTTNLDAVQIDGALTVGVDDTGHDVKFYGAATNAYALWSQVDNALVLARSGGTIDVPTTSRLHIEGAPNEAGFSQGELSDDGGVLRSSIHMKNKATGSAQNVFYITTKDESGATDTGAYMCKVMAVIKTPGESNGDSDDEAGVMGHTAMFAVRQSTGRQDTVSTVLEEETTTYVGTTADRITGVAIVLEGTSSGSTHCRYNVSYDGTNGHNTYDINVLVEVTYTTFQTPPRINQS
jgi:hypothetical protein